MNSFIDGWLICMWSFQTWFWGTSVQLEPKLLHSRREPVLPRGNTEEWRSLGHSNSVNATSSVSGETGSVLMIGCLALTGPRPLTKLLSLNPVVPNHRAIWYRAVIETGQCVRWNIYDSVGQFVCFTIPFCWVRWIDWKLLDKFSFGDNLRLKNSKLQYSHRMIPTSIQHPMTMRGWTRLPSHSTCITFPYTSIRLIRLASLWISC